MRYFIWKLDFVSSIIFKYLSSLNVKKCTFFFCSRWYPVFLKYGLHEIIFALSETDICSSSKISKIMTFPLKIKYLSTFAFKWGKSKTETLIKLSSKSVTSKVYVNFILMCYLRLHSNRYLASVENLYKAVIKITR